MGFMNCTVCDQCGKHVATVTWDTRPPGGWITYHGSGVEESPDMIFCSLACTVEAVNARV